VLLLRNVQRTKKVALRFRGVVKAKTRFKMQRGNPTLLFERKVGKPVSIFDSRGPEDSKKSLSWGKRKEHPGRLRFRAITCASTEKKKKIGRKKPPAHIERLNAEKRQEEKGKGTRSKKERLPRRQAKKGREYCG